MARYPWFPMFVDLSEKNVLVVGAGEVAARRIATLTQFCGRVEVIAPRVNGQVEAEVRAGRVRVYRRCYDESDLEGRDMVLAATNNAELNAVIARACREKEIPVNVASDRALCDFYFPGVAVDGEVAVGITASGRNHKRAREITRRIRASLRRREDDD